MCSIFGNPASQMLGDFLFQRFFADAVAFASHAAVLTVSAAVKSLCYPKDQSAHCSAPFLIHHGIHANFLYTIYSADRREKLRSSPGYKTACNSRDSIVRYISCSVENSAAAPWSSGQDTTLSRW